MSTEDFLRPKMVGKRFDHHSIPLEILGDLAILEEMVIEVAKWCYLKDNPERKRSPRGFTDGVSLRLTSVEEGSAVAVIALSLGTGYLLPPTNRVYFEQAREAIVGAIGAAEAGKPVTAHLPPKSLVYFDRLGRSLQRGEAIVFPTEDPEAPVKLTKESRRRLLLESEVKEVTEEVHLRGAIHAANLDTMTFFMTLPDGSKVPGPITKLHLETIIEAFNGFLHGTKVQLDGIGRFNRSEKIQGIQSIEHIMILDPLDVTSRLEELKILKEGWLDGLGAAPPAVGLDWLASTFDAFYADALPLPYIYPLAEGGVRFEWSLAPHDISLEINLSERSGEWHCLDLETDQEEYRSLSLDAQEGWDWLVDRLTGLYGVIE